MTLKLDERGENNKKNYSKLTTLALAKNKRVKILKDTKQNYNCYGVLHCRCLSSSKTTQSGWLLSSFCALSALIQDSSRTLNRNDRRPCSRDGAAGSSCRFCCSFAGRRRRFGGSSRRPLGRPGGSRGHLLRRRGDSCGCKHGSLRLVLSGCFRFSW